MKVRERREERSKEGRGEWRGRKGRQGRKEAARQRVRGRGERPDPDVRLQAPSSEK